MEGFIFDIKRFTIHDGPGIRSTVFLKGCPLSCCWCHNPESQSFSSEAWMHHDILDGRTFERSETIGRPIKAEDLYTELQRDRIFWDESGGGVSLSGGEPLSQPEFLVYFLPILKKQGIHVVIDTCGYAPRSVFESILPFTDVFLYDLKLMDNRKHIDYTGVSNELILSNLEFLHQKKQNVILRRPVVPGVNDDEDETANLLLLLKRLHPVFHTIHLLPYHTAARNKYLLSGREMITYGQQSLTRENLIPLKNKIEKTGWQVILGG